MEPKFRKGDYIQHKNPVYREPPYDLKGKVTGFGESENCGMFYYVNYKGTFVVPIGNQDEYELAMLYSIK